jgi:threonine/homoserine/homoserine lactone efflux protein
MKVSPLVAFWLNKSIGALFVALGVKLALADQR